MPYKRKYRKRRRRKSRWNRKRSLVSQVRAPIADSQLVRMKYASLITLNAGPGTAATHVYRANSVYDPDATGVGAQPYGHDQWMNFYNHATVVGSRIRALFTAQSSSNTYNSICTIHVSDDTATTTNLELLLERTGTVWGHMAPLTAKGLNLVKNFSTKKFFNKTNVRDCEELRGSSSAGPTDQAHFQVSCFNPDGSTDNAAINVTVMIEYIVLLSERKDLVQS